MSTKVFYKSYNAPNIFYLRFVPTMAGEWSKTSTAIASMHSSEVYTRVTLTPNMVNSDKLRGGGVLSLL